MENKSKQIKFETKIFHKDTVYLKVSDVVKVLGCKRKEFISNYPSLIENISGVSYIKETDYNNLLVENESALLKQCQIEVTKIDTLRSKIDSVMSFQQLKIMLARNYLQIMAARTGCKSEEEYVLTHEIPKEKRKAIQELLQLDEPNKKYYQKMIDFLNNKEEFDIEKIRSFGLDVQYLTSIKSDGRISLEAYVVGKGVFCEMSDLGNYHLWNDMHMDEYNNLILPYCNYDNTPMLEYLINLSHVEVKCVKVNRDFRQHNVIENMIWCIENLPVTVLEDYEHSVFSMYEDAIRFDMPLEMVVKLIKPDAVGTFYTDRVIDVDTGTYLTEFDSENVFAEDFNEW